MELGRPAHVAQPAGTLLDRLELELVAVKGARPLKVLSRELAHGQSAFQTPRAKLSRGQPTRTRALLIWAVPPL